jgi:hypothetical protein
MKKINSIIYIAVTVFLLTSCEKKIDLNSVYNDTIIKYDFKKIIKNFYKKNKF